MRFPEAAPWRADLRSGYADSRAGLNDRSWSRTKPVVEPMEL